MHTASRYGIAPSPASLANLRPWTWEDQERGRASAYVPAEIGSRVRHKVPLIRYIRHATRDGREMADLMLKVLRGERLTVGRDRRYKPTVEQRMSAAIWLTDRAFGKAKEFIEVTEGEPTTATQRANLAALTDAERATLRLLLVKAMLTTDEGAEIEPDGAGRIPPVD